MATDILSLRICAQGFAKVASGQTRVKYRPDTSYWRSRLLDKSGQPRAFSAVHIRNGYRTDSPLAILALRGIDGPVAHDGAPHWRIELGAVQQVLHYGEKS